MNWLKRFTYNQVLPEMGYSYHECIHVKIDRKSVIQFIADIA
ncbi:hypothetical protein [Colwellia sp. Arc7-635]|nr:hypothetical protein [Colwellia sp. Arc7-635]